MKRRRLLLTLIITMLLAACGGGDGEDESETAVAGPEATANALATAIVASSEPPTNFDALATRLDEAEALWNSQGVTAYNVEVRHRRPTWNTQIIQISVENGQVVDVTHTCFPQQDCILKDVEPQELTIENIFGTARRILTLKDPETQMTFNPTYGYPNAVEYEDASWVFGAFEVVAP